MLVSELLGNVIDDYMYTLVKISITACAAENGKDPECVWHDKLIVFVLHNMCIASIFCTLQKKTKKQNELLLWQYYSIVTRNAPQFCGLVYRQGSTPKLTNYNYIDSHAYILKKKNKPKEKKNEPRVSLHEKSDKPNSGKKRKEESLAASFHVRSVTPMWGKKERKKKKKKKERA